MPKYSKEQAIKIVTKFAKIYKKELLNKNFLILYSDKHKKINSVDFLFKSSNYLHLTGFKTKKTLGANQFFQNCIENRLSVNDFEFAKDGTTQMKLDVLPLVISKNLSAKMIGDYNSIQPKLSTEKLAGNNIACIGFVKTESDNIYVPNTVLKADIRDYTKDIARVIAVFRKDKQELYYSECTYKANKFDWDSIKLQRQDEYLLDLFETQETDTVTTYNAPSFDFNMY